MTTCDFDDLEPVLQGEMVSLPSEHRQPAGWDPLAVLDMALAVAHVGELRRVAADALKLAGRSWRVQGKLGLDLQLRDDLRVLHLQQFPITAHFELAVEP